MGNLEKLKKTQSKKETSVKIAEIIWMSIGGLVLLCGVVCLIWSIVINNIGTDTTNMYSSPLFFLVEWQDAFITWLNGWSKLEVKSVSQMGLWLVLGSAIYLLIVLAAYATRQDNIDKKAKAKKLREKNARKFLEEQQLNEEKRKEEHHLRGTRMGHSVAVRTRLPSGRPPLHHPQPVGEPRQCAHPLQGAPCGPLHGRHHHTG